MKMNCKKCGGKMEEHSRIQSNKHNLVTYKCVDCGCKQQLLADIKIENKRFMKRKVEK